MKISQEKPEFKPVTITLETQQELNILAEALRKQAARGCECASEMCDLVNEVSEY